MIKWIHQKYHHWSEHEFSALHKITYTYRKQVEEAYGMIKILKDWLEQQCLKDILSKEEMNFKLSILGNMLGFYFYSQAEAFTRKFIQKIAFFRDGVSKNFFNNEYRRYNDILNKIIRDKFQIYLSVDFKKWNIIEDLRIKRNKVAHLGKLLRFERIEFYYSAILDYLTFLESELFRRL